MGCTRSAEGTEKIADEEDREVLEALARRAAEGDEPSLARLLDQVFPLVSHYCRVRLDPGACIHSGEDVAQEVCLALLSALPTYRREGTSFMPFLFGIASRKVADAYRSMATSRRYLDMMNEVPETVDVGGGPEQAALDSELARTMRPILAQLPEQHTRILSLRVVDGLSAPETARLIGSTPGAVRVTQHRALSSLRGMIGGSGASGATFGGARLDVGLR